MALREGLKGLKGLKGLGRLEGLLAPFRLLPPAFALAVAVPRPSGQRVHSAPLRPGLALRKRARRRGTCISDPGLRDGSRALQSPRL